MKHEIKVRKFDPPNGDQLSCVIFYERSPRVQVSRRENVVVVYPTKKFFVYFFINRETFSVWSTIFLDNIRHIEALEV